MKQLLSGFRSLEPTEIGDYVVKISTSNFLGGPDNQPWLDDEDSSDLQPLPPMTYMVLYWPVVEAYEKFVPYFEEAKIVFFTTEHGVKQFMENLFDGVDDPYLLWHAK